MRYAIAQGLVPLLVLGAFAGLRTSEIRAQRWEDVNLERGFIRVSEVKENTPAKRLVPIAPNLKPWHWASQSKHATAKPLLRKAFPVDARLAALVSFRCRVNRRG
jgi:integrase